MNKQFAEFGNDDGFATAVVATFFAPTQSFTLCNAGHLPPVIFRQATRQWTELAGQPDSPEVVSDTPLGIFDDVEYRQLNLKLEAGDMVLTFSDAVTESRADDGRQLGQAGFLRQLRELTVEQPGEIVPAFVARLSKLWKGNLCQDDATLLLCQATGDGTSVKDNMLAPFRLLKSVADKTELSFAT